MLVDQTYLASISAPLRALWFMGGSASSVTAVTLQCKTKQRDMDESIPFSPIEPLLNQNKQFSTLQTMLSCNSLLTHLGCCSPHCFGQHPHCLARIPLDCSVSSAEAGVEEEVVLVAEEALTRVAEVAAGVEVVAEGVVEAGVVVVA